jgi:hypothetical protein
VSGFDPAFPFFVDGIPCPVAGRSGGRILLAKVRFSEKWRLIIEWSVTLPTCAFHNLTFRIADNLDANTQPRSNRKFQGQVAGIGTFMFLAIEFSHPMRPL